MSLSIVSLISSDRLSGPGVPALQQARLLQAAGHRVVFVCRDGRSLAPAARAAGLTVRTDLHFPRKGEVWHLPADAARLRTLLGGAAADLLFTHQTPEMLAAGLARDAGVPHVRVWHDGRARRTGLGYRLARRCFGFRDVATTETGRRALGHPPTPRDEADIVLPGAVDPATFHPERDGAAVRRALGLPREAYVLALVARWKAGRGHRAFLEAVASAGVIIPRLRALLVGRGELEPALRGWIDELELGDRVRLVTPGEDFPEVLAAADAGVLLEPGSDGTCRAGLELMATGKPLVLRRRGALGELTGPVGRPASILCDDDEELRDGLVFYARDEETRALHGENARAFIETLHHPARLQERLELLCQALIGGAAAADPGGA